MYVVRDGRQFAWAEDARFLAQAVAAVWARAGDAPWRTPAERERFHATLEDARGVYERIAEQVSHAVRR